MNSPAAEDQKTADKFANSWNNVYDASVYTEEQFLDWISPLAQKDIENMSVMELGCGSGALLFHMKNLKPGKLIGIDLGASVQRASELMGKAAIIEKGDMTDHQDLKKRFNEQDVVYSIGVLHHLKSPQSGFQSLVAMTKPGGQFHGWVYAHEGNGVVRNFVDPLRKIVNLLPWSINKYLVALPLSIPFFLYSNFCRCITAVFKNFPLPMKDYMLWISKRNFNFHHHVAFDQLVTPVTHYIKREQIESWLEHPDVDPAHNYIIFRNGNGWKFGGRKKLELR